MAAASGIAWSRATGVVDRQAPESVGWDLLVKPLLRKHRFGPVEEARRTWEQLASRVRTLVEQAVAGPA